MAKDDNPDISISRHPNGDVLRPSRGEAEAAVRTLLRWAGDDPDREGLKDTPKRVARAYQDWFRGYNEDPMEYMRRTFEEVDGYDEMIVLRDISFESHCKHHWRRLSARPMWDTCREIRSWASASWPGWWKRLPAAFRYRRP